MKNKKGIALSQAFGAILTLVLIGVLVIIGIVLFASMITGPFSNVAASSANLEAVTPNSAGVPLDSTVNCSAGNFAVVEARNNSGTGILIAADNYTITNAGLLANTTDEFPSAVDGWVVNYTYTWGSQACTASQDMITQFATYPVLVGLVGTIIFLGIVIGVLVASFVFGRKSGV